jgi:hypothetical protein
MMHMSLVCHTGVINRHCNTFDNNCGSICGDYKSDAKMLMGCVFKMAEKQCWGKKTRGPKSEKSIHPCPTCIKNRQTQPIVFKNLTTCPRTVPSDSSEPTKRREEPPGGAKNVGQMKIQKSGKTDTSYVIQANGRRWTQRVLWQIHRLNSSLSKTVERVRWKALFVQSK